MSIKGKNKRKKASKGKILFVEDDKFLAEMFRQKLVIEGYKPIIAHTAISAVLALRQDDPVAVVLDVVLPDSECWMILEFLRKKKDYHPIPVLILTNWDNMEYKRKAEQLKADAFIIKYTTSPEKLVEIMEKLINKYKQNEKR